MKTLFLVTILGTMALHAQVDSLEGLWQGYENGGMFRGSSSGWPKRSRLKRSRGARRPACVPPARS